MQKKYKILISIVCLLFSSIGIASVVPSETVMFFLPSSALKNVDSPQVSKPVKFNAGFDFDVNKRNEFLKDKRQVKHGIVTPQGVSLFDKGNVSNQTAQDNILSPTKVVILPPENLKPVRSKKNLQTKQTVLPVQYQVYPLEDLLAEMKKIAKEKTKEKPIVLETPRLPPVIPRNTSRPAKISVWTDWILSELQQCDMNSNVVFPTLYWLTNNSRLSGNKTECDMKPAVAKYLQKCHPYPVTYYTPTNNAVPVRSSVQYAVEYLENNFKTNKCPVLDLSGVNFEKVDFLEGDLSGADFSNSYFDEATFSGMDVSETLFENAKMENVLFQNSDLSRASFKNASIKYSHFHTVNAGYSLWQNSDLQNAQFRDVNLTVAQFNNAILQNTAWVDVKANRLIADKADFLKAWFDNVLFTLMSGVNANFSKTKCKNCFFEYADLDQALFFKSKLDDVNFDNASLIETNFDSAVISKNSSFSDASLYKADFANVDLTSLSDFDIETLRRLKVDARTKPPADLQDFDAAEYDVEIADANLPVQTDINRYSCTVQTCEDRLLGRVSNQNLAVRAMTMLSDKNENLNHQVWALCTMGCIAKNDNGLKRSQLEVMAEFIKRKAPWDFETDLFKPYTPIAPEVQMAVYLATAPDFNDVLLEPLDLSQVDLRGADLSYSDLTNVDLSKSFLAGANLTGAKTDNSYRLLDEIVIDEYTKLPEQIGMFKEFQLPDSPIPLWWKPASVRVIRDGQHNWTATYEDIAWDDNLIAKSKGN